MTRKMILLISTVVFVILAIVGCLFCGADCSHSCTSTNKTGSKGHASCENCGKDVCTSTCTPGLDAENNAVVSGEKLLPSCNLTGKEQAERAEMLKIQLFKKAKSVNELNNGYEFIFEEPVEFANQLIEVVNFERVCCPYFTWGLVFEPQNKAAHLQIYGSEAIKEELRMGLKELGLIR